ncbi:hypothetical protein NDU88_005334 [Pleurodeles waltl]|uniref:Uncharacterized protein n=1 Tax=Pleurodeles waltl TaxID=8319 RepID=A0AAV7RJV5_PLEWA|nr:hypothetical protein NDU88_005334 [Pleurodeles waltl]
MGQTTLTDESKELKEYILDFQQDDEFYDEFEYFEGRHRRKGLEQSHNIWQDKVGDVMGPLERILDMAEKAYINESPVVLELLRRWSRRAVVMLGNAGLLAERSKAILMKISPNLGDTSQKESYEDAKGLPFEEGLVKILGKYVATFTVLDKSSVNMRKVFGGSVFGMASRRGPTAGQ